MSLEKWVDQLQARGRYSFRRGEAKSESGLSPAAAKKALQRLVKRGRIAKIKEFFFAVVPLEYSHAGAPPASWFVDDLMKVMGLPYYVGLLSAASLYGSSHQQPQEFQVVTDRSVRPILVGQTRIRFFASKYVERVSTNDVKTPTGSMKVSTPEATVFDLVRFAKAAGHLDNVATVVNEMAPKLDAKRLFAAIRLVHDIPNALRLGHILDRVRQRNLANSFHAWTERQSPRAVLLRTGRPVDQARADRRWHVLVNDPIDIEASSHHR